MSRPGTQSAARWSVAVGGETTTAIYESADGGTGDALFVCAHGAGGHMADKGMVRTAAALRAHGFDVVRFNFLYKEKGSGRPDPMPKLQECITAVVEKAHAELRPTKLITGGRSMGGRAASMLAADGFESAGLFLLAYPLHPAGKPEQLRDAHLARITVPVLCVNGTRDPLCDPELMKRALKTVRASWQMHWIEGADHSFHVLKSSGTTDDQVLEDIAETGATWAKSL